MKVRHRIQRRHEFFPPRLRLQNRRSKVLPAKGNPPVQASSTSPPSHPTSNHPRSATSSNSAALDPSRASSSRPRHIPNRVAASSTPKAGSSLRRTGRRSSARRRSMRRLWAGKKGGFYRDDVWNMRYLKGMAWAELMEGVRGEKKEAEARRDEERRVMRKEDRAFVEGVERSKRERTRGEKARKRRRERGGRGGSTGWGCGCEKDVAAV